ncbi:MAG: macro domain-containing protein [Chloroflexi bacterium]|nr:macro domain-containing protein [Chloroflexota bacterium]
MEFVLNKLQVKLIQGDITELNTDAITNAANSYLILGAGVAGAIARKGGPSIQEECYAIGHCEVGKAAITGGGKLKAKYVIHAVGPMIGEGDEPAKLASAFHSVLELAEANGLNSVALPAISTGVFGFPMEDCAEILAKQIIDYSFEKREYLQKVVVCLYDSHAYQIFEEKFITALENVEGGGNDSTVLFREDHD